MDEITSDINLFPYMEPFKINSIWFIMFIGCFLVVIKHYLYDYKVAVITNFIFCLFLCFKIFI